MDQVFSTENLIVIFQIDSLMSPLTLASLLNITGNGVRDQLVDDVLQVGGGDLAADDVDHLLADVSHLHHQELGSIFKTINPHLPSLGVSSLLGGQLLLACESNAENPGEILELAKCLRSINLARHSIFSSEILVVCVVIQQSRVANTKCIIREK